MKQKLLTLICALLVSISAWAFEVDGICYTLKTDHTVEVTYSSYYYYSGAVVIPEKVTHSGKTYSVTSIGFRAFADCSGLTSVTIPNSVTYIGRYAFYGCSGLTSVTIPNSVTSIGEEAFYGCRGLTSVTIPNSVTSIGESAFEECSSLKTVNFNAKNCISMGSRLSPVFKDCKSLETLNIGNEVTTIPSYAFSGCSGLTNVTIGNSVTSISSFAFDGCSGLTNVTIPNSVTSIGESAFYGCNSLTSVTIPNSVTSIGESAFKDCRGLTSVTIPNSVTSIGESAFYGCNSLTSVTIPNNVTSIEGYAFSGCSGLTNVTITNNVTSIGECAFRGCIGLTSVTIGNSVTTIGWSAFNGCSNLTSVVIPSSVTSIGNNAFYYVKKAFFLTNTKPKILSSAFNSCKVYYTANDYSYDISGTHKVYSLLSSMFEVDGVKYIPTSMNQRTCDMVDVDYSAESVNSAIGPTVKYTNSSGKQYDFKVNNVNMYAAYECKKLSDLNFNLNNEGTIEQYAFSGSNATSINVENTVTNVDDYAFKNCTAATNITASNNGSIGESAFSGCSKATKVTLGEKVTSIGSSCFSDCSSLPSIVLPKLITKIESSTFSGCSNLTSVTLNDALTGIGTYAFKNCSKLASLSVPANVTDIASGAFDGCSVLESLTFMDGVKNLNIHCKFNSCKNLYLGRNFTYSMTKSSPFSGNDNLENVTTGISVSNIPDYLFYNCKKLKEVYISDGVKTIGTYVFSGDVALEKFEVGVSVKSIGAEAFSDCTALLDFTSHSIAPAAVGTEALDDINKLECTLHVPTGSVNAYKAANQWKEFYIEGDLQPRYKVIVKVDPSCEGMGTVIGSNGYGANTEATLQAIPNDMYLFLEWSDGNKENPRKIKVSSDIDITAKFAYRYFIKAQPTTNSISVALNEDVAGIEYRWYVSDELRGTKNITNDLQSTGSYAWKLNNGVWTSGNKEIYSSSSTLSINITAKAGDKLTFDYSVSSESYDYLKVYVGSTQIGDSYSGTRSGKYEYTFTTNQTTTIKFVYSKDGSGNQGSDQATISNVTLGNGIVPTKLEGETNNAVSASNLVAGKYYHCEVVMPDGTVLETEQVQYNNKTAIANIKDLRSEKDEIYDLQGRRLSAPQRGINIINGKKVLVK